MTAAEALRAAMATLRAAHVPEPERDARRLLTHLAGPLSGDEPVPDPLAYNALIAARAARHPVSHLIGRRAFWKQVFRVTPDVLDPRPETETLVEAALTKNPRHVLDLGTGSGCILLSILGDAPTATGLGTDLSGAALAVAEENGRALGLEGRVTWQRADWLDGVEGSFDLIVSNPPYIAEEEMADLSPEVLHEPAMALSPGGDGLGAYRRIARDAPPMLAPGGALLLEIGPTQAAAVATLLEQAGLRNVTVLRDLDGRDRVLAAEKIP